MQCSKFMLTCVAFGLGAVSLASIALAISTDYWLLLYEEVDSKKLVHIDEELSENMTLAKIPKFFPVHSKIGLWRFCVIKEMIGQTCVALDYSSSLKKSRQDDDEKVTAIEISGAQREATPVFLTGFFLVICSSLCNAVGNIRGNVLTLLAAVLYVNAGLSIAVGMVLYITFINDETNHAMKSDGEGIFRYTYGWSAYLVGLCFFTSETAAVICITLFIKRYQTREEKLKMIPGLERKL